MSITKRAYANVDYGNPPLQLVMARPVHPVGSADRKRSPGNFNAGEQRFVIHNVVGQQHLIVAQATKVLCGGEVEGPHRRHSPKQRQVGLVKEAMRVLGREEGLHLDLEPRFVERLLVILLRLDANRRRSHGQDKDESHSCAFGEPSDAWVPLSETAGFNLHHPAFVGFHFTTITPWAGR
jgi:hypothetical protein